jgi:hypothetical protein
VVEEFETLSEQLARVTAECERLREENARLSSLLSEHTGPATSPPVEPLAPPSAVSETVPVRSSESSARADLSVPEKVALFRSLFRGREDVYALRHRMNSGTNSPLWHAETRPGNSNGKSAQLVDHITRSSFGYEQGVAFVARRVEEVEQRLT